MNYCFLFQNSRPKEVQYQNIVDLYAWTISIEQNERLGNLSFDKPCNFVVQHTGGVVSSLEADRDVTVVYRRQKLTLGAFEPLYL